MCLLPDRSFSSRLSGRGAAAHGGLRPRVYPQRPMTDTRFAEMISTIAHELRSPLTSIKGFSATLVKRWDRFSEEQRFQFIETILSDANRMSRIISEVLDLARLETGRLELVPGDAHVASAVEKAVASIGSLDGVDKVSVDVPDDLMVWADSERLERIIATLLENAVKFSEKDPVELTAREEGETVVVAVTDKGIGIEPERIDLVFDGPGPGGQMAGPTGTGLGLYLARQLVEAHGGSLVSESEAGAGSTFTLTLPRRMGGTAE